MIGILQARTGFLSIHKQVESILVLSYPRYFLQSFLLDVSIGRMIYNDGSRNFSFEKLGNCAFSTL